MAEALKLEENEIELVLGVIDSGIEIHVTRCRTTDLVQNPNTIAFIANAHLSKILGTAPKAFVKPAIESIIHFEPAVGADTRFCDFTAEDKRVTAYILANLNTPTLMARIRTLEAEKENLQRGQGSSKLLPQTSSSASLTASPYSNDDVLSYIKGLELKVEAVDAQRKKDIEKVEAQRKKDVEKVEAQRKKDVEKVEAQRKKDLEKVEAQRKKDQSDTHKLKLDLEGKIECLERRANERELEQKQADEATKRYIESLAEDIEATTDFLAAGDEVSLYWVKRRNLLDRAQASLAVFLGLGSDLRFASLNFRDALGISSSTQERQQRLVEILTVKKDEIPAEAACLIAKPAALRLLAEVSPKVRLHGDQIAHGYCQRSWYEGSVARSVAPDKAALRELLDFVLPDGQ